MSSRTATAAVVLTVVLVLVSVGEATPSVEKHAKAVVRVSEGASVNKSRAVTAAGTGSHGDDSDEKVYLRSITALMFSANARTTAHRGSPQSQLQCVGGSASGMFWAGDRYPRIAQCANIGWDGSSIQWRCEATLLDGLEFGDTLVHCEGYEKPGDQYVYKGSCRLEYTLNFTEFNVTFAHVIYASVLSLGLLWFYWQCRFCLHSRVSKVEDAVDRRVGYRPEYARYGAVIPQGVGQGGRDGYTGRALE